jgi:leader peptidase (prepilin peptidase)/N-methyltransferase
VLLALLVLVSWTDSQYLVITNRLNFLLAAAGTSVSTLILKTSVEFVLLQALIAFGFFWLLSFTYSRLRRTQGLGGGDVKFLGAAATWVGLAGLPWTVLIASLSGLTFAIIRHLMGHDISASKRLAFGPHLSLGLLLTWLMRDEWIIFPI